MIIGFLLSLIVSMTVQTHCITAELPSGFISNYSLHITSDGIIPGIPGAYAGTETGFPFMPELPWNVPLPSGSRAISISSNATWESMAHGIIIPPLTEPVPLIFKSDVASAQPVIEVYSSDEFWPSTPVRLAGTGFRNGTPEAELLVTPFRWNPVSGELQKLLSLDIRLQTVPAEVNPLSCKDSSGEFRRMLIVTDLSLEEIFNQLAERRTDQGILTEVVTMDQVYSSVSGRDDAEKLRNFVINYYVENGLDFLLLGGDTNIIPFRYAYAMTSEAGFHPREDSLPCDLYFSDLDGSWDANGNSIFGEIDDDVDLHPDIFVGRATVENSTEAEVFVNNLAAYEDFLRDDHYQDVLFLAMILWWNPYTNSGESKDYIDEHFLPDFLNITKLYQALGNENLSSTMAAMNEGQNFINHDGHAWYSSIGVGEDYMTNGDMDTIDSDGRYAAVMYSIGCWSAAFDFDAIAEHFITNPNGCGVGYVGNSSYGWGSPGNPCYGYSDALDHLFHQYLYDDWSLTSGELLGYTKEYFIPYSQWENVYRWHQYDVNLLGDPSFRPYRTTAAEPEIQCPDIITSNTFIIPVQISGVNPEGLTICVHDNGNNWETAELDATGYIDFCFSEPMQGSVRVTVTGPGVRRNSVDIPQASGPYPVISELLVIDNAAFGHLSPGCYAELDITLMNQGTEGLSNVVITITDVTGPADLHQEISSFGSLPAGSSSEGFPSLSLYVNNNAVTGSVVALSGQLDSDQGAWNISIPLLVYAPGLYFTTYDVDDSSGGNSNGIPEPGETFQLNLNIANLGLLCARDVTVLMTEYPSWISWPQASTLVDSIPTDSIETFTLICELSLAAPSPSFPWLYFDISTATTGYFTSDTLRLTVGETGISDDVESGSSGWTHSGTYDMWNITGVESHSPDHSWHCGNSDGYVNGMDCGLISPELILAPQASLSFWTTFDVPIYGSDGLYVLLHDLESCDIDTLDFIGSGGALNFSGKGIGTGWVPFSYTLSTIEAGSSIQLEFSFVSDEDGSTGRGFYIDDISLEGAYTGSTGLSGSSPQLPVPMGSPFPNPAYETVNVHVFSESQEQWVLCLYSLYGRLVIETTGVSPVDEIVSLNISELSPGIYFLRFSADREESRRLVILR